MKETVKVKNYTDITEQELLEITGGVFISTATAVGVIATAGAAGLAAGVSIGLSYKNRNR